jgi:hypothetical protein
VSSIFPNSDHTVHYSSVASTVGSKQSSEAESRAKDLSSSVTPSPAKHRTNMDGRW